MRLVLHDTSIVSISSSGISCYARKTLNNDKTYLIKGFPINEEELKLYENLSIEELIENFKKRFSYEDKTIPFSNDFTTLEILSLHGTLILIDSLPKNLSSLNIKIKNSRLIASNIILSSLNIEALDFSLIAIQNLKSKELAVLNVGDNDILFGNVEVDKIEIIDAGNGKIQFDYLKNNDGIIVPYQSDIFFEKGAENVKIFDA